MYTQTFKTKQFLKIYIHVHKHALKIMHTYSLYTQVEIFCLFLLIYQQNKKRK